MLLDQSRAYGSLASLAPHRAPPAPLSLPSEPAGKSCMQREEIRVRIRVMLDVAARGISASQVMVRDGIRMVADARSAVGDAREQTARAVARSSQPRDRPS